MSNIEAPENTTTEPLTKKNMEEEKIIEKDDIQGMYYHASTLLREPEGVNEGWGTSISI